MNPVLLVDDDTLTCTRLKASLERWNIPLETATTLDRGYDLARDGDYSLILVDLFLGNEVGITLIRRLRDMQMRLPIIVYSGHVAGPFPEMAINAGATGYIDKRIPDIQLAERIRIYIRRAGRGSSERRTVLGSAVIEDDPPVIRTPDRKICLTEKEFDIMEFLFTEKPKFITAEEMSNKIWGAPSLRSKEFVDHIVKRLQHKLSEDTALSGLFQDHRNGFRFNPDLL